jgi:hypothetical protein
VVEIYIGQPVTHKVTLREQGGNLVGAGFWPEPTHVGGAFVGSVTLHKEDAPSVVVDAKPAPDAAVPDPAVASNTPLTSAPPAAVPAPAPPAVTPVIEPPAPAATEPPAPAASSAPACVAAAPCAAPPALRVPPPAADAASTPFTVEWLAAVLPDVSGDEVKLMWSVVTRRDGPKTVGQLSKSFYYEWTNLGIPDVWVRRMLLAAKATTAPPPYEELEIVFERLPTLSLGGRGIVRGALIRAGICTLAAVAASSIETLVALGIPESIAVQLKRAY